VLREIGKKVKFWIGVIIPHTAGHEQTTLFHYMMTVNFHYDLYDIYDVKLPRL